MKKSHDCELTIQNAIEEAVDELLVPAMKLLERANDYLSDQPPDKDYFRDYYLLTGEHMILTDEGWEPGSVKEQFLTDGGEINDEINV